MHSPQLRLVAQRRKLFISTLSDLKLGVAGICWQLLGPRQLDFFDVVHGRWCDKVGHPRGDQGLAGQLAIVL